MIYSSRRERSVRWWRVVSIPAPAFAVLSAVSLVIVPATIVRWGGTVGLHWWTDVGWMLTSLLATGACLATSFRVRGRDRLVWGLFSAGCASWCLGQIAWNYYDLISVMPAAPALPDIGYLGFAPPFLLGLLCIGRGSRMSRILIGLDILIVMCVAALVFAIVFWHELALSPLDSIQMATDMAYPVLYGTLSLSALLVPVQRGWHVRSIKLLLLGLAAEVIPFVIWTPMLLRGAFVLGTPLDGMWMIGMVLIAASAMSFTTFPPLEAEAQVFGATSNVPLFMTLGSAAVYLWAFHSLHLPSAAQFAFQLLLLSLVVLTAIRLRLTLRHSGELFEQARSSHAEAATMAAELRRSEARFRAIFDRAPIGIQIADMEGRFVAVNRAAEEMLGYTADEMRGMHWTDITHPDDVAEEDRLDELLVAGEIDQYQLETRERRKDGTIVWARQTVAEVWGQQREPQFAIAMIEDITERKRAERALSESEESFRMLFAANPHPMWVYDLETLRFLEVNETAIAQYGYARDEFLRMRIADIRPPDALPRMMEAIDLHRHHSYTAMETQHRLADGRIIDVDVATHELEFAGRRAVLVMAQNITERKLMEEQLKHQALYDSLTHLPNRTLLYDRLEQAITIARRDLSPIALLLMDLDGFKDVNDTLGHHYGDLLLEQVGVRLRDTMRTSDTVARLGGDEFAVILPATDEAGAIEVARAILTALVEPFSVEGRILHVEASVGIALFPQHGSDVDTLLRHADVAMYVAKRLDDDRGYAVYLPEQDAHSPDRLALLGDLRATIERDELYLQYQPKINLRTGNREYAEALVRWKHPDRGPIGPDQFVPMAEDTGLIKQLTLSVLRMALLQCHEWRAAGIEMNVAVNLSVRNLHDPQLSTTLADMLQHSPVPASALTVEITESTLMADPLRALSTLTELHDMGVRIAIDDFGTGYSSLGYLRKLPVDEVKIDRSFVTDMTRNENDATIVRSVIDLGHNLGLQVVAEGVEDQQTMDMLTAMGCDHAQGYHIAAPTTASDLVHWLDRTELRAG